jgi:hypothetical protein
MIYKKENIDMSLVECPYEEEYGYIHISDDYTNKLLKLSGYSDIDEIEYYHLLYEGGVLKNHLQEYSTLNASNAYHYAKKIIKGRFELGESAISTNSHYSYRYAIEVIEGRFELGEPIIATDFYCSYLYAIKIIKGRFELGESAISTNPHYSCYYELFLQKGIIFLEE